MLRITRLTAVAVILLNGPLSAQAVPSRSLAYLFTTLVDDVRALWVNPAGLAKVREASIMVEAVFDKPELGDVRLAQWTLGFNTRGLSVGYQRDRLQSDSANQLLRIGLARPFRRGSFGVDLSFYWSNESEQALNVGLNYRLLPSLDGSLVVRNIGQPVIRSVKIPVTGVAGLGWSGAGGAVQLAAEMLASDRIDVSGVDMSYRAGARFATPEPIPIAALLAVSLGSDIAVDRWFLGLAVGGSRRAVVGGTFLSGQSSGLDIVSATGLATDRQAPLRR